MTPPFHFAIQRTSWDADNGHIRPDSPSDLICREIQRHMPDGSYSVGREPRAGVINIYTSTRPAFNDDVRGSERLSVLLGHGVSDKGIWTRHAPYFDHVITPGPMHTELVRRAGVPSGRIHELGYAKLDPIFNGSMRGLPKDSRKRVLYAPTHGGGGDFDHMHDTEPPKGVLAVKRSSWWRRDEVLRPLNNRVWNVIACHHPRYTPGHTGTLTQYVGADVAICDGGSTLYEAMILSIPVVTPGWITGAGHRATDTTEGMLYRTRTMRIAHQPRHLHTTLHRATTDGPTDAERVMGERVLTPAMRGVSGKAQAAWLMSLA